MVEVINIFSPREAIKQGLPPGEWAELGISFEEYCDEFRSWGANQALTDRLNSEYPIVTSWSGKVSERGNVMVQIHRKDGPRLPFREHLTYRINQLLGR